METNKKFWISGGVLVTRDSVSPKTNLGFPRWIGVGLIIFSIFFLGALLRYQLRLVIFGTKATGEVVAFDKLANKRRAKPRVRVITANGETIEFYGTSLKNVPLAVGEVVPVYYIPSDPVFGEIATFRHFWLGVLVGSVLSILLFSGGVWVWRNGWRR